MEANADELNLVMSTSETHNLANLRMPRERSFAALKDVVALAGWDSAHAAQMAR